MEAALNVRLLIAYSLCPFVDKVKMARLPQFLIKKKAPPKEAQGRCVSVAFRD